MLFLRHSYTLREKYNLNFEFRGDRVQPGLVGSSPAYNFLRLIRISLNFRVGSQQVVNTEQIKENRSHEAKEDAQNQPGPFILTCRDKQPYSYTNMDEKLEN